MLARFMVRTVTLHSLATRDSRIAKLRLPRHTVHGHAPLHSHKDVQELDVAFADCINKYMKHVKLSYAVVFLHLLCGPTLLYLYALHSFSPSVRLSARGCPSR